MKIAINANYGGFSLSTRALEMLLDLKGIQFERTGGESKFRGFDYWHRGAKHTNENYISEYDLYRNRTDPDLINVIETLGKDADGFSAEIAIIDIPDDVDWQIEEYDGFEHVAEKHRVWYA